MCYKIDLYGNKPYFIVTFESLQASALVTWLVKMADIDRFNILHNKLFAMATDRPMSAPKKWSVMLDLFFANR